MRGLLRLTAEHSLQVVTDNPVVVDSDGPLRVLSNGGFGGIHIGIGGLLVLLVLSFIFKRDLISPLLNSGVRVVRVEDSAVRRQRKASKAALLHEPQGWRAADVRRAMGALGTG